MGAENGMSIFNKDVKKPPETFEAEVPAPTCEYTFF